MNRTMNEAEKKAWIFFNRNCVGTFDADINYQFDSSELAVIVSIENRDIVEVETINGMMDYFRFNKRRISGDSYHYGILFLKKFKNRDMKSNTLQTIDLYLDTKTKYQQSERMTAYRAIHQARLTIINPTVEDMEEIFEALEEEAETIAFGMSAEVLAERISAWAKMNIPTDAVGERLQTLDIKSKTMKGQKYFAIRLEDSTDISDKWFLKFIE